MSTVRIEIAVYEIACAVAVLALPVGLAWKARRRRRLAREWQRGQRMWRDVC